MVVFKVEQSGTITPSHLASWTTDGVIQDAGSSQTFQTPTTVSGLGSANPPGQRWIVTDAISVAFNSVVTGGGTNTVPVYSDGISWRVG